MVFEVLSKDSPISQPQLANLPLPIRYPVIPAWVRLLLSRAFSLSSESR
jgi:hypothetical protein